MAERGTGRPSALIVCVSEHHGNTDQVAQAMAEVLGAEVVTPEAVGADGLRRHDLIGFGSGIYFGVVHPRLLELIDQLPPGEDRCAFTFSTSGMFLIPWMGTSGVQDRLRHRGYRVLGDFNCRGLDTVGPLRFIGGVNRGHPDGHDLERARRFARDMRSRALTPRGAKA
ncbi:MAG: flavodoxin family protein [Acidimicrobiales bacterium]